MTFIPAPLLVFDLDGTLADTAGDLIGTLNVILEREGVAPLPLSQARFMLGAGARALIVRGLEAAGRSASPERLEEMFQDFLVHYEANICHASVLFPGVVPALDRFEEAGWAFAVCTNKFELHSVKLLSALGIASRFRTICGQNTFSVCKPHKDALLQTIAHAGCAPASAIMVGDSRTDIDAAKNSGIPVVAVDFGYTDQHVSAFNPDRVISHFDELWDAVEGLSARV